VAGKRNIKKILIVTFSCILGILVILAAAIFVLLNSYKKEIVDELISEAKKNYGINVIYNKIRITVSDKGPQVSISLTGVTVINENNNPTRIPLFNAGTLRLSFNAAAILNGEFIVKEVSVKNGNVLLEKDIFGNSNYDFKKASANSDSLGSVIFRLKTVHLKNIQFDFYNRQKQKHIGLVLNKNSIELKWFKNYISGNLKGDLTTNEFLFKPAKGPLLFNKGAIVDLDLIYLKREKNIFINQTSSAIIEEQKYFLAGMVYLDSLKQVALNIKGEIKDFKKTISLLTRKIQNNLSSIHIKNPIKAEVFFISKFNKEQDPELILKFSGTNNFVTLGSTKIPYSNLSYSGQLLCLPDSDGIPDLKNGNLIINKIKGKVYDFPFSANIIISDLVNPYLNLDAFLKIDGKKIKFKPGKDFDLNGSCYSVIKYEGPVDKLSRLTFLNQPMKLLAEINFKELSYRTKKNSLPFTLNGKAFVANDKVKFSKLMLATVGGDFNINGTAEGFTSYVCDLRNGFKANITASADYFNLTPLLKNSNQNKNNSQSDKPRHKNAWDKKDFEFNLSLDIKKLLIRKLKAENAKATIYYTDEFINLKKLNFNSCGGSLSATGYMRGFLSAKANLELKNMDVRDLFIQCENFNQKAMTNQNVTGVISATAIVRTTFNKQFKVQSKTLGADINVSLKNGHLLNYEPLQKITHFIFRKRNFKDITFTEINPEFILKGSEMKIKEMEVASSALNFFVSGTYDFNGRSNLNLIIPWSNLKARGKNYIPKKLTKEGETGKGLKLNVYGYPNKLKVRLGNK